MPSGRAGLDDYAATKGRGYDRQHDNPRRRSQSRGNQAPSRRRRSRPVVAGTPGAAVRTTAGTLLRTIGPGATVDTLANRPAQEPCRGNLRLAGQVAPVRDLPSTQRDTRRLRLPARAPAVRA